MVDKVVPDALLEVVVDALADSCMPVDCIRVLGTDRVYSPIAACVGTEHLVRVVPGLVHDRQKEIRRTTAAAMELQDSGRVIDGRRQSRIQRYEHRMRP